MPPTTTAMSSPPTTTYTYQIHHLPDPSSDPSRAPFLAGKLSALRLHALTTDPTSFSSTFALESQYPASQWLARLSRPAQHIFIAAAYPPTCPLSHLTLDTGSWIGAVTMLGPQSLATYALPDSANPLPVPTDDEHAETRWHLTFMYNSPLHRRRGVAKLLLEGAIAYAASQTPPGRGVRVRALFPPWNDGVRNLYASAGFVDAGRCSRAEAYVQNGDADLVPADGGASDPEDWLARHGFVMESVTVA